MSNKVSWPFWLVIAIFLLLAPFASNLPDGLEKAAYELGFIKGDKTAPIVSSPLAHYSLPGLGRNKLPTILAGAIGVLMIVLISWSITYWRSL
jgi:hypothetical protein